MFRTEFLQNKIKDNKEIFKTDFLNESGMDANYLNVHITNFLKQNNLQTLMQAISIALVSNGYKKQADMFKRLMSRIK